MTLILDMPCQDNAASYLVDDVSASNNNGAFDNEFSQAYATTGPGGSLTSAFDGTSMGVTSDLIRLTTGIIFLSTDQFGLGFFAKQDSTSDISTIIGDGGDGPNGFSCIQLDGSGNLIALDDSGNSLTKAIGVNSASAWHFYFINRASDGTGALSVDGGALSAMTGTHSATTYFDWVAAEFGNGTRFPGKFCKIPLYNTTRTQPQIAADALIGGIGGGGGTPRAANMTLLGVS